MVAFQFAESQPNQQLVVNREIQVGIVKNASSRAMYKYDKRQQHNKWAMSQRKNPKRVLYTHSIGLTMT